MHNMRDLIARLNVGDVITADWLNRLRDAATGTNLPPGGMQDGAGVYPPRPFTPTHWRLVKTAANPEVGPYPQADEKPDTYWFKFLRVDLTTTPLDQGYQSPTLAETDEAMGLVHWLGNRFLPEGTIVRAWYIAPGRTPTYPESRSDLWIAFDQQQVATFVTFELKAALNKTDATVKATFLEYWDGQQPWDDDTNPTKEFNLVNTGLIFPWEWNLTQYPIGTKGIACLDPESTLADALSYRILFMAKPEGSDPSEPSTPSDPGPGVEACVLTCGYVDSEGCYVVVERTFTFPPGTTWKDGFSRRLMMCAGSDPDPSDPPPPSFPSMPSSPLEPDYYIWHFGAAGAGYWMITPQIGVAGDVRWQLGDRGDATPAVQGEYHPGTGATGIATVSAAAGFDLNVSGTLDPDAAGYYAWTGQNVNGLGIWKRTGGLP